MPQPTTSQSPTPETDSPWAFSVRGEGTEAIEIDIYDTVGRDYWGDGSRVSAKAVRSVLRDSKSAKSIAVRINSAGGEVVEGMAIYSLLRDHSANVTVYVDSLAASIASVIAMAGDEIVMAENAFMMIHNPWGLAIGEAKDMRRQADLLDKMRDGIVDAYVARTQQPRADVLAAVESETWMTAAEAKKLGYADSIVPLKAKASKASAAWNIARFENVPADVLAALQPKTLDISTLKFKAEDIIVPRISDAAAIKTTTPPPAALQPSPAKSSAVVFKFSPEDIEAIADRVNEARPQQSVTFLKDGGIVLATTTTPPPAAKEPEGAGEANMFAHVLIKLGLAADASEADAVEAIDKLQLELTAAKADTSKFVAATGKAKLGDALGTVEAWRAGSEELASTRIELARLQKNAENAEAQAIINQAQQARKIMPATRGKAEKLYIEHGLEALKAHIDALTVAPPVTELREPQTPTAVAAGSSGMQHDGKCYEELNSAELHNMRAEGPLGESIYQQLRRDWIRRGSPKRAA